MEVFREKTALIWVLKALESWRKGFCRGRVVRADQQGDQRARGGSAQGAGKWGSRREAGGTPVTGCPPKPAPSSQTAGLRSLRGRRPSLGRSGTLKAGGRGRGVAFLLRKPQSGQRGGLTVNWSGNSALGKDISFPLEIFCDFFKKLLFGKDFI